MSDEESILDTVLNQLAWPVLNHAPRTWDEEMDTPGSAIDDLQWQVRLSGLAISLALLEVARAIQGKEE